jgi:hypothetical protein
MRLTLSLDLTRVSGLPGAALQRVQQVQQVQQVQRVQRVQQVLRGVPIWSLAVPSVQLTSPAGP